MRLSTRAHYALRALVDLALYSNGRPISLKEIATRENIPLNYLEQLFTKLRRGNIVESVRGPGGGYRLARDTDQIAVGEIVVTLEGTLTALACLEKADRCPTMGKCTTHNIWLTLGTRMQEFLDSVSLKDLAADAAVARTKHAIVDKH